MADEKTIVKEMIDKIDKNGGTPSEWYTGIATNPKERLEQHKALDSKWIYDNAGSNDVARKIEDHMTKVVKTKGGGGGGDKNSTSVYCYKITATTDQNT